MGSKLKNNIPKWYVEIKVRSSGKILTRNNQANTWNIGPKIRIINSLVKEILKEVENLEIPPKG